MQDTKLKAYFYFCLAVLLSLFLLWLATVFLFRDTDQFSQGVMFLFGCGAIIGGVCLFGDIGTSERVIGGLGLFVIAIYSFGRALGWVEQPWMARIAGILCVLAVGMILYITWPPRKFRATTDSPENLDG